MMFLWLPFLLVVPFALFWMVRHGAGVGCCGVGPASHVHGCAPAAPGGSDPVEIARLRLARGEITPAEFDEIRAKLG